MSPDVITAARPADVARAVESLVRQGRHDFVVKRVAGGGMLDMERLGAARYAAGVHSRVELEAPQPAAASR